MRGCRCTRSIKGTASCHRPTPAAPDFNPLAEALKFMGIKPGVDGGLYRQHVDAKRWEEWTARPANIHEGAYTDAVRRTG